MAAPETSGHVQLPTWWSSEEAEREIQRLTVALNVALKAARDWELRARTAEAQLALVFGETP